MDIFTKGALWDYWKIGGDEIEREDGYYNRGNLPEAYHIGNSLHYQDIEWYEALEDSELKDEALRNKAIMEGLISDDESRNDCWKRWKIHEIYYHNYDEKEYENKTHKDGMVMWSQLRLCITNSTNGLVLPELVNTAKYVDAQSMFVAIKARFGGNEATKKTQKALLKQQYENFNASSSESLDSIFNRLQKLVSRLAILGVVTPPEDLNVKFLRSLPSEWDTHVVSEPRGSRSRIYKVSCCCP
ncbi:hypothetical protein Tco_0019676 [Tanacetum coccineum]